MNHLIIKFTHGVEVGARLAYLGHYNRTKDENVRKIANDELEHQARLLEILYHYKTQPSELIDTFFFIVGSTIRFLCNYSPLFLLNKVASIMEIFAIVNYDYLATIYPEFSESFLEMEEKELEHKYYFLNTLANKKNIS